MQPLKYHISKLKEMCVKKTVVLGFRGVKICFQKFGKVLQILRWTTIIRACILFCLEFQCRCHFIRCCDRCLALWFQEEQRCVMARAFG